MAAALRRYHDFSASHRLPFECMYYAQQSVRRLHGAPMNGARAAVRRAARVSHWAFRHYLDIAPPSAALPAPPSARGAVAVAA